MLDSWDKEVDKQRSLWRDAADAEVRSSGRSLEEMPSVLGKEIEESVLSLSEMVQTGMARALYKKTESEKKIIKKPSQPIKPLKQADDKGPKVQSWVIGPTEHVESRGIIGDMWKIGENAIDAVAESVMESEDKDNGLADKSSVEEQRGKKKKKKKAILKLLLLGAVLKAKIGTLLQILSFKLQVKFFIIAVIGLAINLARFWIELKHKHQPPQKVIYYEHAQHQHHYDHEEEPAWGPWSRSMEPEQEATDADYDNSPYKAQENTHLFPNKPLLTLS
ncbi:uncharacterized protein LOC126968345 [Leptidea sinapis]|uniref:uncharacterized protein LOC126968345 n=1 Tax=Leptidea sinapis TaxID=189913 RepID=UPI0021C48028|nr:uncharacterized protein LOC126968345 [Leptidea sinapis]